MKNKKKILKKYHKKKRKRKKKNTNKNRKKNELNILFICFVYDFSIIFFISKCCPHYES